MTELHPQLQQDCIVLGKLELCHLLLMNDANYPWFILVPDRKGISEIFELDEADQKLLLAESSRLGKFLVEYFKADKLNVAALGNIVPQLHVHHVVRYQHDISWPKPVWGQVPGQPYSLEKIEDIKKILALL